MADISARKSSWLAHPLHAAHHFAHPALFRDLLHHFLHLFVLLKQTIDIGDLGTATFRYALFARTVDDVRESALVGCHRVDNGAHLFEHAFIDLGLSRSG